MLTKNISNADPFQIDDVIIFIKGAFDEINDLLKPSTDIWNNNKKTPFCKEQLRLCQQTFVEFSLANYRNNLRDDFIEESYFLYNKSNLIKESFITDINKLISIYGSISYFGKKINKIAKVTSSNKPLEFNVKKGYDKKLSSLSVDKN